MSPDRRDRRTTDDWMALAEALAPTAPPSPQNTPRRRLPDSVNYALILAGYLVLWVGVFFALDFILHGNVPLQNWGAR